MLQRGVAARGGEEIGNKYVLPQAYAQCKAAREAKLNGKATEVSAVHNFGCEIKRDTKMLGSFENNTEGIKGCFVGSRVQRGGGGH